MAQVRGTSQTAGSTKVWRTMSHVLGGTDGRDLSSQAYHFILGFKMNNPFVVQKDDLALPPPPSHPAVQGRVNAHLLAQASPPPPYTTTSYVYRKHHWPKTGPGLCKIWSAPSLDGASGVGRGGSGDHGDGHGDDDGGGAPVLGRWQHNNGTLSNGTYHSELLTLSPVLEGGFAVLGELDKLIPISPARFLSVSASQERLALEIAGEEGEQVAVTVVVIENGEFDSKTVQVSAFAFGSITVMETKELMTTDTQPLEVDIAKPDSNACTHISTTTQVTIGKSGVSTATVTRMR